MFLNIQVSENVEELSCIIETAMVIFIGCQFSLFHG